MIQKKNTVKFKYTKVFEKNWLAFNDPSKRFIVNQGGSRSSKSFSILQLLVIYGLKNKGKQITIARRGERVLKRTIFKDFKEILLQVGLWNDNNWKSGELEYVFSNGTIVSFVSLDNPQKLRGLKHDVVFLNEANEAEYEDFMQINIRTVYKLILDWNPSEEENFIWDLLKREDDVVKIHSTYLDNNTLSKAQIKEIEALIDQDENLYRVYTLGLPPIKRETVFTNWSLGKFPEEVQTRYGMDFGFNDPNVLVETYLSDGVLYVREVFYESYLEPNELLELMEVKRVKKNVMIEADHKPEFHKMIRGKGYAIKNAKKDIQKRLTNLKRIKIVVDPNSKNLIKELKNYSYKKVNNTFTDIPIDKWNHAIDSMGYAYMSYLTDDTLDFFVI